MGNICGYSSKIFTSRNKDEVTNIISQLPSRQRTKTEINGGLIRNPLAKFRAAVKMALVMQRMVEFLINKKKERKKKRKKGEILDFICKIS